MKRTYIAPATASVSLEVEGMVAASMGIGGSSRVENENQVLVNHKGGWNSSDWSDTSEEE